MAAGNGLGSELQIALEPPQLGELVGTPKPRLRSLEGTQKAQKK